MYTSGKTEGTHVRRLHEEQVQWRQRVVCGRERRVARREHCAAPDEPARLFSSHLCVRLVAVPRRSHEPQRCELLCLFPVIAKGICGARAVALDGAAGEDLLTHARDPRIDGR